MTAPMVLDDHADWAADALATIIGLSLAHSRFTADDLAREMRKPPHANMPGAAFSAAKSLKLIRAVGYQTSSTKSRKNGVVRVWARRKPNEGEDT